MQTVRAEVSYRDKTVTPNIDVSLGTIDVEKPDTIDEAVGLYGEEKFLSCAHHAYVIEQQGKFRDANRPDKPKSVSLLSKFKQLSGDKQEELLKAAGIL